MSTNKIFQDPTTTVPRNDPMFEKISFSGSDIGGRSDFIPKGRPTDASVQHVATAKAGK